MPEVELTKVSNARKAAIMMVLMGPELSGNLVKHMTPRQVARLAREISNMGDIDNGTVNIVLQDYMQEAMAPKPERGSPELARHLLSAAHVPEEQVEQLLGPVYDANEEVLGTLLETPPETLAAALEAEHPQTISLILLHMPAMAASKLLNALPENLRAETVIRMATLRQVNGKMIGEIADSLKGRLKSTRSSSAEDLDGFEKTAGVLAKMGRMDIRKLLDTLEPDYPEEVTELRGKIFTFDSLITADDAGLQELLKNVDSAKVAMALFGSGEILPERFFSNLSERAGSMLREEMEFISSIKPADQEAARKEIVDMALQLENDGKLNFAEANGEEEE